MQRSRTKTIDAPVPRDVEAVPMRAEAIAGSPGPVSPSAEQIRLQVARIVSAPAFSSGPRTKNFLQYIVDQTLTGNARRLKQYTIATEVLGRDSSFNPEADPIVRLEAGNSGARSRCIISGRAEPTQSGFRCPREATFRALISTIPVHWLLHRHFTRRQMAKPPQSIH